MALVLKKGADVEGFKKRRPFKPGKIDDYGLGNRVLDLALSGEKTADIARIVTKEAQGVYEISPSTVVRWIEETSLFERRAKRGTRKPDILKEVRRLFVDYRGELMKEIEQLQEKHQRTVGKLIARSVNKQRQELFSILEDHGLKSESDRRIRR
jgi:hypothetical protein